MFKKLLSVFLFLVLATSCTHHVTANLYIDDFSGSGRQDVLISIKKADLLDETKTLESVRDEIIPIVEAAKPISDLNISTEIKSDVLYISFEFTFTDLADYEKKAEKMTGHSLTVKMVDGPDPFLNVVTFSGLAVEETDFIQWAIKAIEDNGIYGSLDLNVNTVGDGFVLHFQGNVTALSGKGFTTTRYLFLENLSIETTVDSDLLITRKIVFAVDPEQTIAQAIVDGGKISTMFQQKILAFPSSVPFVSTDFEAPTAGGDLNYTITFSSKVAADITGLTNALIPGINDLLTLEAVEGTDVRKWQETTGPVSPSYTDVLNNPIDFTLNFPGYAIKTVDTVAYDKTKTYSFEVVKQSLTMSNNSVNLNIELEKQKTSYLIYYIGGAVTAVVLIGGIILFVVLKKKKPKIKAPAPTEAPKVETPEPPAA